MPKGPRGEKCPADDVIGNAVHGTRNLLGMDLDDSEWTHLLGGYRIPYDPRPALHALEVGEDPVSAWKELWEELYHQGDVGEASYAAVPHLVRIHGTRGIAEENTYALAATIEEARRTGGNPDQLTSEMPTKRLGVG